MTEELELLNLLVKHIDMVRANGKKLFVHFISEGKHTFALSLMQNIIKHDNTKLTPDEFYFLTGNGSIECKDFEHDFAIIHHWNENKHHPESWGGIDSMPEVYICEMVCDWYARCQEHGVIFFDWFTNAGYPRYKPSKETNDKILKYVKILEAE